MNDNKIHIQWIMFITLLLCMFVVPDANCRTMQKVEQMDHYSAAEGLSSDMVHGLSEDSLGHLWACTDYGMSVFDGSVFKRYEKASYPSILRNDFFCSGTRKDGTVLIGSYLGVALRYDMKRDTFVCVAPEEFEETYYKQVSGFFTDDKNETYMWTSGGIYKYDDNSGKFICEDPLFRLTKDIFICSFHKDELGRYWICAYNTVKVIDQKGNVIKDEHLNLGDMYASKIVASDKQHILITCFSNAIIEYTISEKGEISEPKKITVPFSNITSILKDKGGRMWFTTDGSGLWYTDEELTDNATYVNLTPAGEEPDAISKLYAIQETKDGDIWLGSQNTGLWRFKRNKSSQISFSQDITFPKKLCSDFIETADGTIYVSSDGGGLSKISKDLKHYEPIPSKENNKNALSLAQEENGNIWIATWGGGMQVYSPKENLFRQEKFEELKSTLNCFFSVEVMRNKEIWICTGGDGLYVRRTDGHWEKCILPFGGDEYDMWAYGTTEGKNGTRWIFTTRSIWRVNGTKKTPIIADMSKQKSHDPINMSDAVCDSEGNLFVSCGQYILHITEDGKKCDTIDFLPKDNYSSIEIDKNDIIYVVGNRGIYKMDYKEKKHAKYAYDFKENATGRYGAQGSYMLSDGRLMFGSKDGFFVLSPNQKEGGIRTHHFAIQCLTINGRPYRETDIKHETKEDGSVESLTVKHNQNEITFAVDLVNYTPKEITNEYQLEGLTDKWTELDENKKIVFSYIPSGEYTLRVRSHISGSQEATEERSVHVTVLPPWWQTWWFKVCSSIFLALLIGSILYLRIRRLMNEQNILQEKVKERTHELDEKNAELRLVLQDKDRLISVIAHDLKNPMFAIVSALEAVVSKGESGAAEKETLAKVHTSAKTLQDEMVRLLEWAKAKKEEIECKKEDVNVKVTLESIGALLGGLVQKKGQKLECDVNVENCAFADSRMFSTIIRNLINNAVKFTPEGGKIELTAWQEAKKIYVRVKDNGVGMSQEKLDQLRKNGHCDSTLGTSQEKGSGLGFGLCRDYLSRIDGEMEIESTLGEGTQITISVPASETIAENAVKEVEKPCNDYMVDKELMSGNTALVVEDDPLIRQSIQRTLEQYMTVVTAGDGEEGIHATEGNDFDIILSDVEMPKMDGIEMSKRMSSMESTYGVPLLFLSAKTDESDRLMGLLSGAVDYIPKPFSSNELLIKINNILVNRRKQQQRILQQNLIASTSKEEKVTVQGNEEGKEEKMNPFLQKMVDEIAKNYKESGFSIETLAESMNVSQSTLARRIKSITGKTPIEILVEYRLNAAMQLLKSNEEELQINEIAYECGFSDPAYFTRKFKEFFGHTPRAVK